ncbi:MAG TPA: hypothetical protein DEH78_20320 [Solibacterales bacterium]|nr:hypothetical protein [Bryobacterales bacterium]
MNAAMTMAWSYDGWRPSTSYSGPGEGRGALAAGWTVPERDEVYRCDVVGFARERLGFEPDRLQEDVLRGGKRVMLCCSRQWGKSTVTAVKALHQAYFDPQALVLIASPSLRQSRFLMRTIRDLAARLGVGRLRGDGDNEVSLQFPGGGRVVGLPGNPNTVVGFAGVSMLIFDEAARVRDELFEALNPVLAVSGGTLWCLSTPMGKRGFFWRIWARGDGGWMRISAPATECARIPAAFLEQQRRDLPDRKFRQEYLCEFLEAEGAVFTAGMIANLFSRVVQAVEY